MDKIVLIILFILFFWLIRKNITSGKVYFFFLFCMCLPVSLIPGKVIVDVWYGKLDTFNMLVLAGCLICGFFPWLVFDKYIKQREFYLKERAIKPLKIVFLFFIICSLFSIAYLMPYAIKSFMIGANDVRASLRKGSPLPSSILTTIAVAVAACHIFAVIFFYIACLTPKLKKYRPWLMVSSCSYIVSCTAITGRDGLIILPCLYIIFFMVFRNSLAFKLRRIIENRIKIVVSLCVALVVSFSISRFYEHSQDLNELYTGTVGYISQQPYVFNATIEHQNDFWGFERSFPLLNRLMGIGPYSVKLDRSFEWSFGTMYSEFYSAYAWYGLFFISLVFVCYYTVVVKLLCKRNNDFGLFMLFAVYLFIVLTGMFYMRAGKAVNMNVFYLLISILPIFYPNLLNSRKVRQS